MPVPEVRSIIIPNSPIQPLLMVFGLTDGRIGEEVYPFAMIDDGHALIANICMDMYLDVAKTLRMTGRMPVGIRGLGIFFADSRVVTADYFVDPGIDLFVQDFKDTSALPADRLRVGPDKEPMEGDEATVLYVESSVSGRIVEDDGRLRLPECSLASMSCRIVGIHELRDDDGIMMQVIETDICFRDLPKGGFLVDSDGNLLGTHLEFDLPESVVRDENDAYFLGYRSILPFLHRIVSGGVLPRETDSV